LSNKKLERRFSQIEGLIGQVGVSASPNSPEISAVPNTTSTMRLLSAALMDHAENGRRKWSAIGVDEWIEAGKWWLMKVVYFRPLGCWAMSHGLVLVVKHVFE
jgi:hypothetical protein